MLKQMIAVSLMNLRNLPQRISTAWVIVVGIAATVAVMTSLLAMEAGFSRTLTGTARADRAIVLRAGSDTELSSTLSRADVESIENAPGIAKASDGSPLATAETVVVVSLARKHGGAQSNVTLRGVGKWANEIRPEIRIVAGRLFRPGLRELVVGKAAAAEFGGLDIGRRIRLRDSEWTIVGWFESGGDAHESELLTDSETMLSAYRRTLFQSILVRLTSASAFEPFKAALTTNPALKVSVQTEADYFASQSRNLTQLLNALAGVVGGIMTIGALFGALNTMYAAVSTRSREIATLRALGFGAWPIVTSIFVESLGLSLAGSGLGIILAWMLFSRRMASTLGADFSQIVFHLTITSGLLATAILIGCGVGLVGGMLPAIRAARLPIIAVLRAE